MSTGSTILGEVFKRDGKNKNKDGSGQTPFLFFIALGLGIVFTNLWVVLGVRYCCRQRRRRQELGGEGATSASPGSLEQGRSDEWTFYLNPLFATGRTGYYRNPHRFDRRLLTNDDLNARFPVTKYKEWILERERAGLSADGGISSDVALHAAAHVHDEKEAPKDEPEQVPDEGGAEEKPSKASDEEKSKACEYELTSAPDWDENAGDLCSVCLDTLEPENDVRVLTCDHVFHDECIRRWLTTRKGSCPLCKRDYCLRSMPRPTNNNDATANANNHAAVAAAATAAAATATTTNEITQPEPAAHNNNSQRRQSHRRWLQSIRESYQNRQRDNVTNVQEAREVRNNNSNRRLLSILPVL